MNDLLGLNLIKSLHPRTNQCSVKHFAHELDTKGYQLDSLRICDVVSSVGVELVNVGCQRRPRKT